MEVRQSWVYGDSPGEHFSRELRGVGIFFNCQNSSGAGSQLLDNEHCRFAVQNGTTFLLPAVILSPSPSLIPCTDKHC